MLCALETHDATQTLSKPRHLLAKTQEILSKRTASYTYYRLIFYLQRSTIYHIRAKDILHPHLPRIPSTSARGSYL